MYKITWDEETGGVLLNLKVTSDALGLSPRPVFYEELDMLGMDKLGWRYPHCKEPLLWAINKQYFYRGILCFNVKGANIYDAPTVELHEGVSKDMTLQPVDVTRMIEKNSEPMFLLENEAIEFIRDTYLTYSRTKKNLETAIDYEALALRTEKKTKRKMAIVREDCDSFDVMPLETAKRQGKKIYQATHVDLFIASFSGGKDSQVVLDLCTRSIPPTEFQVLYSDTGYELPSSLELYEQVKEHYHNLFPSLRFTMTRNHESVLYYWDKMGTPSDTHRWCCSVMKTAPLYRALKIEGTNKQAKVLAFDGVRAEESTRRSSYLRIGKGVKHSFVINARPILTWNNAEIFLYLFKYNLSINKAYRIGKPRVGCVFCPFSSPWDDMIVKYKYQDKLNPFLNKVVQQAMERKIPNINEYIKERRWKLRASGNFVKNLTQVIFNQSEQTNFEAKVFNPHNDIETWLPVIGDYTVSKEQHTSKVWKEGEVEYNKKIYRFTIKYISDNSYVFTVYDAVNIFFIKHLKRISLKAAYCIQCEGCEIECPTGALSVYPKISINKTECKHCYKCLDFHDHGCIVADSLSANMENKIKTSSLSRGTFGIHEEWIVDFLENTNNFWKSNTLGKKQVDSFKAWLRDAELIDTRNEATELCNFCANIYADHRELVWEIIWINLCYNSILTRWFINKIREGRVFDRRFLKEYALEEFSPKYTPITISYALTGFLQIFKYSPIGNELQQGESKGKGFYQRSSYLNLTKEGLVYSIYKFGRKHNVVYLRINDFYEDYVMEGPVREFCISKKNMDKLLREIDSCSNRVLIAELNMGLDNISLRNDLNALDAIKTVGI